MDKSVVTFGKWEKRGNFYIKDNIIYNPLFNTEYYYNDIINGFLENGVCYGAVDETLRHRNKGEEASDYVSDIAGLGMANDTHSHYSKNEHPVKINLPDGSFSYGIIRIANHEGDIGTFAANHPDIDFCISLVIGEVPRMNDDKKVPTGRVIHMFEYILDKKQENKERILMNIADKVIKIKSEGWCKNSDVGIMSKPKDKTNGIPIIKEEQLRKIIREEIGKYLNKYYHQNLGK